MLYQSGIVTLALTPVVLGLPKINFGAIAETSLSARSEITWDMKDIWTWGSPGGSGAGFGISAATGYFTGAPSLNVSCWRNNNEPDDWKICTPRLNQDNLGSMSFRRLPRGPETLLEDMWASHQYTSGDLTFNITGCALVDRPEDIKGSKKMPVVSKEVV